MQYIVQYLWWQIAPAIITVAGIGDCHQSQLAEEKKKKEMEDMRLLLQQIRNRLSLVLEYNALNSFVNQLSSFYADNIDT